MSGCYFYQTLTSDHAKVRKKISLHSVDLKLGNVIYWKITQSLDEFHCFSCLKNIFDVSVMASSLKRPRVEGNDSKDSQSWFDYMEKVAEECAAALLFFRHSSL